MWSWFCLVRQTYQSWKAGHWWRAYTTSLSLQKTVYYLSHLHLVSTWLPYCFFYVIVVSLPYFCAFRYWLSRRNGPLRFRYVTFSFSFVLCYESSTICSSISYYICYLSSFILFLLVFPKSWTVDHTVPLKVVAKFGIPQNGLDFELMF